MKGALLLQWVYNLNTKRNFKVANQIFIRRKTSWRIARPWGTQAKEMLKITREQIWQTSFRQNSKHIKRNLIVLFCFVF